MRRKRENGRRKGGKGKEGKGGRRGEGKGSGEGSAKKGDSIKIGRKGTAPRLYDSLTKSELEMINVLCVCLYVLAYICACGCMYVYTTNLYRQTKRDRQLNIHTCRQTDIKAERQLVHA